MATGRPALFSPKAPQPRPYRALALTAKGQRLFEAARAKLKKWAHWPGTVSDADVIESLVRGEAQTKQELAERE